jgi:hypothetical protein
MHKTSLKSSQAPWLSETTDTYILKTQIEWIGTLAQQANTNG